MNNMNDVMLTTVDNPFNPFTHFDDWFAFDTDHGHYTCEYLARITRTTFDSTDADDEEARRTAIDEIIRYNPLGIHRKVYRTEE